MCGKEIPDQGRFCFNCGKPVEAPAPDETARQDETSPPPREARVPAKSGPASVIGWALIVIAILGGWQQRSGGDPITTLFTVILMIAFGIGLIQGWSGKRIAITLACVVLVPMVVTIARPKFNQAKRFANETGAISAIRNIHAVQVQYQSQYGRFATSLAELGPPQSGAASPAAADLIDNTFAAGVKSGYKLAVTGNQSGYAVNANPEIFGTTGTRTFFSDQTMVIRANDGAEPATAASKELK
jgi:hypothetical protein